MRRCNIAVVCLFVTLSLFNNQAAAKANLSVKRPERLKIDPEVKIKFRIPNDFACELVGHLDEGYCYGMESYSTPSGFAGYRSRIWMPNSQFMEKNKYGYSVIFIDAEQNDYDKLELNDFDYEYMKNLSEAFFKIIRQFPDLKFRIDVHSLRGELGADNRAIGAQHAKGISSILIAMGVPSSKFEAKGFANTRPLKGIPPSDHRNQRIEVTVIR